VLELHAPVRSKARADGGVEFKHTGDGIGAWFTSPADAVDCAMQMGRDLERASARHPETPLMMRAGVAMGEPVEHGGDLFGLSVVRASRLCDAAADGTVMVSDEVADAARGPDRTFRRDGERLLKGFPDPVGVHTVITAAHPSTSR
jgi:class 3 adenylate cyclase